MFTGIVEESGRVVKASEGVLEVATPFSDLTRGESVSVNGACLTVAAVRGGQFTADLSEETLRRTNLAELNSGARVNLERAVKAGERMGGHVVQGHVDTVGQIAEIEDQDGRRRIWIEVPASVERYLVEKGSVGVDGVSLTISSRRPNKFAVDLIPVTLEKTRFGDLQEGDSVNLEADVLAKYVESMISSQGSQA